MIKSLLIANRGEIACRIIRTARDMGIHTVAVYSDADAKALHVRQADEAVHIGASPARESYLVGEKIIAAAKATGAEAIHPGYGFLSENAEFAQAVIDAGLIWVGPRPASITAMGLKDAAKKLMAAAGVPVTPGYMGERQEPDYLAEQAADIGYPVLIKAVAGGGGKGMRLVERAEDFADALTSCQREASSSFGNAHVLIEKYIQRPRHIEVQVFGDTHGNIVHLFERDCSLQRRHQKVIEEAPAPGMDEETREQLCAAAVKAAHAVDYVGAGTIEFIADASEGLRADRIWFMEMNTRLQVEHPVTEEITGVDLVEWQLRVASGEALPLRQDELFINGHAVEVRLYAEDPSRGFLPSTGRLDHFKLRSPPQARVETGVDVNSEITPYYDPMIAKLVLCAFDRETAIEWLAEELEELVIAPVKTNASFLARCLRHPEFQDGSVDTGFIARYEDELIGSGEPTSHMLDAVALTYLYRDAGYESNFVKGMVLARYRSYELPSHFKGSVWNTLIGFRGNASPKMVLDLECDGKAFIVNGIPSKLNVQYSTYADGDEIIISSDGDTYIFRVRRHGANNTTSASDGAILSPMPGKIIAVEVAAGDTVIKGQKLLTLEAMKMEHTLTAPFDGVVEELNATPGAQVQVEAVLAKIVATEAMEGT